MFIVGLCLGSSPEATDDSHTVREYDEAVDVLLGKWEDAKGIGENPILPGDLVFDTGDKRLILQTLALRLHEQDSKEIQIADLGKFLHAQFEQLALDEHEARQAAERFLSVIEERTGLLSARGEGVYAFSVLKPKSVGFDGYEHACHSSPGCRNTAFKDGKP